MAAQTAARTSPDARSGTGSAQAARADAAGGKQPYAIARTNGELLAFAGLCEGWTGPDRVTLRTFAILTTAANGTMLQMHERMPVVLEPAAWSTWLGKDHAAAAELMAPAGDDVLKL